LDVDDHLPGIGFIPAPVQVLGRKTELDDEVARQVLRLNFAPLFSPQPEKRRLVLPMMIRASEPPTKYLRLESSGVFNTPDFILHHLIYTHPAGANLPIWVNITHVGLGVNWKVSALTGAQIRSARALLKWSALDLARRSSLGVNTIRRAEAMNGATSLTTANDLAIRHAFEADGVEFIEENGGGPGVRLRKRHQKKA
jgi:hypothetical protein